MRHYEIVVLVHPDQSSQVEGMMGRYRTMIERGEGIVHRMEDWGRRPLAFIINKVRKAHYFVMNIECDQSVLDEVENSFKFNDAILRNLIMSRKEAITEKSLLAFEAEEELKNKMRRGDYQRKHKSSYAKSNEAAKASASAQTTKEGEA